MSATAGSAFQPKNVEVIHRGQTETIDVLGIRMEWKVTEHDTGHQYCLFEMTVPPGTGVPLNHHEPQETFWVVDGELEFGRVGAAGPEWLPITAGDTITVPSWAFHGFRNRGQRNARVLLLCAAGLEPFFREVGVPRSPAPHSPQSRRRKRSSSAYLWRRRRYPATRTRRSASPPSRSDSLHRAGAAYRHRFFAEAQLQKEQSGSAAAVAAPDPRCF
jgi:mannose-6-phosphate isomerase-like protein (cupin superfamily)